MVPFGMTIPATVPQRSEIPEGLMNYSVYLEGIYRVSTLHFTFFRALSRFIIRCIEGLNALVVLITILNFMSFIRTNNTVEIN